MIAVMIAILCCPGDYSSSEPAIQFFPAISSIERSKKSSWVCFFSEVARLIRVVKVIRVMLVLAVLATAVLALTASQIELETLLVILPLSLSPC